MMKRTFIDAPSTALSVELGRRPFGIQGHG